jgi:hypothetical protein
VLSFLPRKNLACAGLFLSAAIFTLDAAAAEPSKTELPRRTPGQWRMTTVSPEIGMRTVDVCITDSDSIIGPQAPGCAQPSVTYAGDQMIVTIECGAGDRREVQSLLFTGDFKTWYRAQSKVTSGGRRSGFAIDASFLGSNCKP